MDTFIIKITKKENVKVNGVKYVAVFTPVMGTHCKVCAFTGKEFEAACRAAPCLGMDRNDRKYCHFVRKGVTA